MGFSLSHAATVSYELESYLVTRSPTRSTWLFRKGKRVPHSSSGGNSPLLATAPASDPLPYDTLAPQIQSHNPLCHFPRGLVSQCQLRLTLCQKRVATSGLTCRKVRLLIGAKSILSLPLFLPFPSSSVPLLLPLFLFLVYEQRASFVTPKSCCSRCSIPLPTLRSTYYYHGSGPRRSR
jgi:hypothetical protein